MERVVGCGGIVGCVRGRVASELDSSGPTGGSCLIRADEELWALYARQPISNRVW